MEHQVIIIHKYNQKEENVSESKKKGKALASEEETEEIPQVIQLQGSITLSSLQQEGHQIDAPTNEIQSQDESEPYVAATKISLTLIQRRLEERRQAIKQGKRKHSSTCIFRFPLNLVDISVPNASQPELVSIGPYHRGKDHLLEFEEYKWCFLDKFLSRSSTSGKDLSYCFSRLKKEEEKTRDCYSDIVPLSSHDFVEMMLLDGCFLIELLLHLNHGGDAIDEDDPIFTRPWLIPILIRDILKLENQLPYFVLDLLYQLSLTRNDLDRKLVPLPILTLRAFDLAFPRPLENLNRFLLYKGEHLLHIVYSSLVPPNLVAHWSEFEEYRPSDQSIQCVTQLRPSGVKFKSRKGDSFLDINFQNQVLEIPCITINDFTSTLLINCVALEQCLEKRPQYFTDYISFMSCLISQPRDVAFLCSAGIITRFSKDDKYVVDLFTNLGQSIDFNIRDCYLSKQFREVESYYSSNWATMRRTYFSSPWSFISLSSAIILLVLTMIQSVTSVLSYTCQLG